MRATRWIAPVLVVFLCTASFTGCSGSPPPKDEPRKVQCRSCHDVVPAGAYCASCGEPLSASMPPGSNPPRDQTPPPPPPRAAKGNYVLTFNKLGKTNFDFLLMTLKADADFQSWITETANPSIPQYTVTYTGPDVRKAISDAAERSGCRVYVLVNGRRVEVNNAAGE